MSKSESVKIRGEARYCGSTGGVGCTNWFLTLGRPTNPPRGFYVQAYRIWGPYYVSR